MYQYDAIKEQQGFECILIDIKLKLKQYKANINTPKKDKRDNWSSLWNADSKSIRKKAF